MSQFGFDVITANPVSAASTYFTGGKMLKCYQDVKGVDFQDSYSKAHLSKIIICRSMAEQIKRNIQYPGPALTKTAAIAVLFLRRR